MVDSSSNNSLPLLYLPQIKLKVTNKRIKTMDEVVVPLNVD
jgi:hypothetical protein